MRRLTILVACWKRHALTRLMLSHTQRVAAELNAALQSDEEVAILPVISDEEDPESGKLCEELNLAAVSVANSPLGAKWNAGMQRARLNSGAVMLLGSDDFVTAPYVRAAWDAIFRDKVDAYGPSDFFFCGAGPRVLHWDGYSPESGRAGEPMGAGRTFSAKLLDILKWKPWPDEIASGLDGACWQTILAATQFFDLKIETTPIIATGGMLMDVKRPGEEQMSAWSRYEARGEDVPWQNVLRHYPADLVEALALDAQPLFRSRQREAGTDRRAKVGLAMIVKDSEATIERAIRGAFPIVGEIVAVLDDRSTDGTKEILNELGAMVYSKPWAGFGEQRNIAHALTRADWHLVLDADEVIDLGDIAEQIEYAEAQEADAVLATVLAHSTPGQAIPMIQARVLRRGRTRWAFARQNEVIGIKKSVMSTAIIRNSYVGRLTGIANAAIPELEAMYANPTETLVTPAEERAHASVHLARSYMHLQDFENAKLWARRARAEAPPEHLRAVMAAIVEAWAILFCGGMQEAEDFARAQLAVTPGVAEYSYLIGGLRLTQAYLDATNPGRYAMIQQGCLAFMARFPEVAAQIGFGISFEAVEGK